MPEATSRGRAGSGLHLDVGLCLLVPLTTLAWMFETTPRSSLCPARSGDRVRGLAATRIPNGFGQEQGKRLRGEGSGFLTGKNKSRPAWTSISSSGSGTEIDALLLVLGHLVREPSQRAGPIVAGQVVGVGQLAALQRETAAADAVIEIHIESLQFPDALGNLLLPAAR